MCNKGIEKKIEEYFLGKKEVIAVYIFGSYAQNAERHLSDIDIGILMDRMDQDIIIKERSAYMIELSLILKKDVHPIILNSASEALLRQVLKKGKGVLVNNAKEVSRKRMVMFSEIADYAYYQGKMQSGLIRRVMRG
jgi:predicted nucleotidyltransferase